MAPTTTYLDYARADDHLPDGDPIGQREMAELTGRSLKAIYKWHERKLLPLADGPVVNGLPTWRRRTFLAWAYRRGFTVSDTETVTEVQADGTEIVVPVPRPCHHEAGEWADRVPLWRTAPLRSLERSTA